MCMVKILIGCSVTLMLSTFFLDLILYLNAFQWIRKLTHPFFYFLFFIFIEKIVWVSVAILICLFLVQRFGTEKVGYSFAPILTIWFMFIGSIGLFNFCKHDPSVVKAFNPRYIIDYFKRNNKDAWISLGGVILCTTGNNLLPAPCKPNPMI